MSERAQPLTPARLALCLAGLGVLTFACITVAVSLGAGRAAPWHFLPGGAAGETDLTILLRVRLPRVLLTALLGGSLTVAGVVFQALLRNPLADPYVLGVSGGASIGGVLALILGLGSLAGGSAVPLLAFAGALGALVLIERVATVDGRMSVYTVLLTGAIFNAFSAALIYFVQSVASLRELQAIVFYLMGHVPDVVDWIGLLVCAAACIVVTLVLWVHAGAYNALALGEEGARQVGVNVERLKRLTFVLGSLLTAVAVAVAGLIGFVGLVVPHALRLLLGPDHRLLVPAGFLGGAAFLVIADLVARIALAPVELPVGVVTALVGGPWFLWLLRRRREAHGVLG